jgi:spore cortex formation protein SpoVR/YcgB (stage V sporulation)
MSDFLFEDADWDFGLLDKAYDAVEDIALNDLGLDVYPNQVEIISSEQMLESRAFPS